MRHRVKGQKLGRTPSHRRATLRNMATSLFTHSQITTTVPKAKALQPFVEHLIHIAKKGTLHARRQVIQAIGDPIAVEREDDEGLRRNRFGELIDGPRVVRKLMNDIAPRYTDREGGYTRIVKLARHRIGDGSDLCVIQLVGGEDEQGPQVAGQYSRRREKANKRMEYAARLRKSQNVSAGAGAAAATAEADEATEADTQVSDEAPAETSDDTSSEAESPAEDAESQQGDDESQKTD